MYERDLDLDQTLDCGQAFRWYRENGIYRGYCVDTPLEISGADGVFRLKDTSEREFSEVWKDYFDLDTDYSQIKAKYSSDETLRAACEFSSGIRLLRQDAWEALVSYIFSQHNNIPRIKGIIERLVTHYGHFPNAEELAAEVKAVIAEVGATSMKEMGKVMGVASKRLAGRADGKDISAKVRELLA